MFTKSASRFRRTLITAATFGTFAFVSACSDDNSPKSVDIHAIIIETADGDKIYTHGDHWHGSASVDEGHSETLNIYYIDFEHEGHDAPDKTTWKRLPSWIEVTGVVESTDIAQWTGDRLTGKLTGIEHGATRINFVARRAGTTTTLYEAPPLNVQVLEHDHDHDDH